MNQKKYPDPSKPVKLNICKININKNKYPTAAISFFALIFNIQIQTKKAILI